MMYNQKDIERIIINFLRGIAIVLVVLGHSIQCGSGDYYYNGAFFYDPVFALIYSFHLPLFMIISGYLFAYSLRKYTFIQILKNKVIGILIPIYMWAVLTCIKSIKDLTMTAWILNVLKYGYNSLWFLWAVFFSAFMAAVIYYIGRNNVVIWMLSLVACLLTPDISYTYCYKFMYVCFLIGMMLNIKLFANIDWMNLQIRKVGIAAAFFMVLWLIQVHFFNYDSYIYTSGWTLIGRDNWINNLGIDVYRTAIGVSGSLSLIFVCIWLCYYKLTIVKGAFFKVICVFGKSSMGIYIIQSYLLVYLHRYTSEVHPNLFLNIGETVIMLLISIGVVELIRKTKITSLFLLGGR